MSFNNQKEPKRQGMKGKVQLVSKIIIDDKRVTVRCLICPTAPFKNLN